MKKLYVILSLVFIAFFGLPAYAADGDDSKVYFDATYQRQSSTTNYDRSSGSLENKSNTDDSDSDTTTVNWKSLDCKEIKMALYYLSHQLGKMADRFNSAIESGDIADALAALELINDIVEDINEGTQEYKDDGC